MGDSEDWANTIFVANVLLDEGRRSLLADDPSIMVARITGNIMPSTGPTELFSRKMPIYGGSSADNDTLPIDVLYGRYLPERQTIEIYVNRIRSDAPQLNCEFDDLLAIV